METRNFSWVSVVLPRASSGCLHVIFQLYDLDSMNAALPILSQQLSQKRLKTKVFSPLFGEIFL